MTDPTSTPRDATTPGDRGAPPTTPASKPASTGTSSQAPAKDPLRGSRTSGLWIGVVALGVLLILLIVFVAQNTQAVTVSYFGWEGQAPLAVALLVAATAGLLLAAIAATMRIWQVRRRVHQAR